MPNWCSTTYRFHGTQEELETLNEKIKDWTSSSKAKTDFGDPWLGNIVIGAGFKDNIDNPDPSQTIRCRGRLIDISDLNCDTNGDYSFDLYTETAWVPMAKMWYKVIESLGLESVGFSFFAEECGCEIFWIYDPKDYKDFTNEEVWIDAGGDYDVEKISGYYTRFDAINILNEFFKTNYENIDEYETLCRDYEDEHEDSFIDIHVFEINNELQD